MKKLNLNHYTIIIVLCASILSSCTSSKITFQKVYEKEMPDKQNIAGYFDEERQRFVGVSENTMLGSFSSQKITVLDMNNGNIIYSKNAKDMGDVSATPDYNIDFINNVIIFSSARLTNSSLSFADLESGQELWSISRGDSKYKKLPPELDFSWMGGYALLEEGTLRMYDVRTGDVIWEVDENSGINISKAFQKGGTNWTYLPDYEWFLFAIDDQISALNAQTGSIQWTLNGEFGNLNEGDFFLDRGKALFYGPQGRSATESIGNALLRSSSSAGRIAGRAIRASESGIQDNPLFYIDLKEGKLLWETTFKTSGQTYPLFYEDILILSDLFTYALDEKTGEVIWQTVSEDRLENEENRRLISEFTPFRLDASNRVANDNLIIDDNIFVVHSTIFDKKGDRRSVSLKRLNIRTGEEIWESEPERMTVSNFFFNKGKLFVQTSNRRMYDNGELRAIDPGTGKLLYEIEANASISEPLITDHYIHFKDLSFRLYAYDINTGTPVNINTPMPQTLSLETADNFLYGRFSSAFSSKGVVAFLDPKTFEVERQVEIPFTPSRKMSKGKYLYLYNDGNNYKSLLALDFDRLETRGSFRIKNNTKIYSTVDGKPVKDLSDTHFYVSDDGENIYLTEKKTFYKYKITE